MATWTQDEAGPYQTLPYPGPSWQPEGQPAQQPHEYVRNGTAKILTLFHPVSGEARVKGVTQTRNAILYPWLKEQILSVLQGLPESSEFNDVTSNDLCDSALKFGNISLIAVSIAELGENMVS